MPARCSPAPRLSPLYFAECRYGRLGNEFQATDRDKNSRAEIVRQIRSGGIDVVKVLEIDEEAGSCRDVTEELIEEAIAQRDPPHVDELAEQLRDMLIDYRTDIRKHSVFGW